MCETIDLNQIATVIGNQHRLAMLVLMMEGRYFTAKELAYGAGLQPSAATSHLKALVESKMVKSFSQGRFKYFTLHSADVASVIESMMCLSAGRTVRRSIPDPAMCCARFCFNHLAGRLGVGIYQFMHDMQYIINIDSSKIIHVSDAGSQWLQMNNFNCEPIVNPKNKSTIQCMDWSERRPHIGGALGNILAEKFIDAGWITRKKNSRVVTVTTRGYDSIARIFNIDMKFFQE